MTILRDWQIRELCELPSALIVKQLPGRMQKLCEAIDVWDLVAENTVQPTWSAYPDAVVARMRVEQPGTNIAIYLKGTKDYDHFLPKVYPDGFQPMISPFVSTQCSVNEDGRKIPSYGLSSMGYDIRLQPKFKIFTPSPGLIIDPLIQSEDYLVEVKGETVVLEPGGYLLGVTVEQFIIPEDIGVIALGKSTWARAGAVINVTPLEPGWRGELVVEIANPTPVPLRIHSGVGIAQLLFSKGEVCEVSYADRSGKYMDQEGIVAAKL